MSRRTIVLAIAASAGLPWATACGDGSTEPSPDPPRPTTVTVSPATVRLTALGETVQLTTEVRDQYGNVMAGVAIMWSSSSTSVATVDQSGLVSAVGNGVTDIAATAGTTARATVAVAVQQVPSTIALSTPRDSLAVGDSIRMTAEVFDGLGNVIAEVTLLWSSSDTTIMTVDPHGWVRARSGGSAKIAAAAGTTASAVAEVTAVQVPNTIVLSAPADSVAVGDSIQMTAEAFDALSNAIANVTFEWSSSDTTIATVTREGWVRAGSAGTAEITARVGDLSASTALVSYSEDHERAALEAFYYATGGPEWKNDSNWLTDKPLGQWYGVETDDDGRVVELDFSRNGLRGRIPVEIVQLTELRGLRLWGESWGTGSSLTGPIPPELAKLAKLNHLNLTENELTGEIPPELASIGDLKSLSLSQNRLTGPIPPELGDLSGLTGLSLMNNRLTGPIPSELGNLTSLRSLKLAGNELTGEIPAELGHLVQLTELYLGGNDLTGGIPAELGNLARLETLTLYHTSVAGPIPSELGGLSQLRFLWLADNAHVTGSIPAELGNLHNLEELWMANNDLGGSIPPQLGDLSRLERLLLHGNPLTGPIPPELGRLTQLTKLELDGTRLTGPIPPEL